MSRLLGLVLLAAAVGTAWNHRAQVLSYVVLPEGARSAHERYTAVIKSRGLHTTELGRSWLDRGDSALDRPARARPSFTVRERFTDDGGAFAWKFPVRRGQRLRVEGSFAGELFLDLIDPATRDTVSGSSRGEPRLAYDVDEDGELILRAQAELLRSGPVEIAQTLEAAFEFPVQGVSPRAVGGIFGDPRDSGRRSHEGIDIFAARGTPAIAAVDGWITGAATNRLGGKVVWLWAPSQRVALYYAHLDRQAVSRGERVEAGDVIGYVGTTGNARGTSPHLHFGVYATGEGAIDPLPWVCDPPCGGRQ